MKKISMIAIAGVIFASAARADDVVTDTMVIEEVPAPVVVSSAPTSNGTVVSVADTVVTIDQVRNMNDGANVVVRGNILERIDDEKYTFQDASGTITIEVEDDVWGGRNVSPDDTVILYGEVDRGLTRTEIEVDRIEIMN